MIGKQNTPLLSVIVPVYKVEAYLHKCVDSILAQTYTNLEIILVDDGSPDGCPAICDAYASQDKRVKVIHQANAGVSAARNTGLDAATGDYIGFVDSDDWIESDYYEKMYFIILETGVELVSTDYSIDHPDYEVFSDGSKLVDFFSPQEALCGLCLHSKGPHASVWSKLFSCSSIEGVRFRTDITIGEDMLFSATTYSKVSKIAHLYDRKYHYYQRSHSAMNIYHESDWSVQKVSEAIYSIMNEISPDTIDHAKILWFLHDVTLADKLACVNLLSKQIYLDLKKHALVHFSVFNIPAHFRFSTKMKMVLFYLGRHPFSIVCRLRMRLMIQK